MAEIVWIKYEAGDDRLSLAIAAMEARGSEVFAGRAIVGISTGGCVDAVGTSRKGAMRRKAHAHTSARDRYRGFICIASSDSSRVITPTGKPTRLLWHEWAHIWANTGHTERFRALLRAVGQPAAAK